ncbi:MAG: DUF6259 domain-containing protein, partial [Armatimonadetes bacterium]|nr:DUF6259 domain-containing protein [Armatimonadota bacterium]
MMRDGHSVFTLVAWAGVASFAASQVSCAPQVAYRATAARLILETPRWWAEFDTASGSLLRFGAPGADPVIIGGESLWRLRFRDGSELSGAEASVEQRPQASFDDATGVLTLSWQASKAAVAIEIRPREDGMQLHARVGNRADSPVLTLVLPGRLAFAADGLNLVTWPESVGLGLTRRWFSASSGPEPSRWETQALGDRLMRRLVGFGARMLPLPGTPRPLRVTEQGRGVFGEKLASRLDGREVTCIRPPDGLADAVLLENDDGPFLSGFRLGGEGWFVYFAGPTKSETIIPCALALIRAWAPKRPDGRLVLINLRGRMSGGWSDVKLAEWEEALAGRPAGLALAHARSAQQLREMLAPPTSVVVNPYAECLPASTPEEAEAIVDAIKRFIAEGGLWIDAGCYPFHYILKPAQYGFLRTTYPPCFSDFIHVDSTRGPLAIYAVQSEGGIFVPAELEVSGGRLDGEETGFYGHQFRTWVAPGQTWEAPPVVLSLGHDLKTAAQQYASENGFTRMLGDKMPARKLEAFLRSVLVRLAGYGRSAADYQAYLERLPSPCIVHMTEHLNVGFDKAYPDYLPPPPSFGTMDELRALYRRAKDLGLLMMPYVNPTWWCDQSQSLARYGQAALAISPDGQPYREWYGPNGGWTACMYHPLVRELDDRCLRDFVDDLGCDILFQDQVGARGFVYDLNPAAPAPYAYTEGMISLARHDSGRVPLSTERGWDGLLDYEVQFCGVAWAAVPARQGGFWSPPFWELYGEEEWQISPLALYVAHDRVAFALHDLGHFCNGEPELAMLLPLGHQLSFSLPVGAASDSPEYRWLTWLDVLQKHIVARLLPLPLDEFDHVSHLAVRARYGDWTVIGSIEQRPVEAGEVILAAPGWYARLGDGTVEAGRLVRYAGRDYGAPLEFVRERRPDGDRWWLYGTSTVLLPAEDAKSAVRVDPAGETPVPIVEEGGRRWIRATPSPVGEAPPAGLEDKPLAEWPQAPKHFGLINLAPNGPGPAWADAGPAQWREALATAPVLSQQLLEVRELTDPEDLLRACAQPRQWFAIINPYGEIFPVPAAGRVEEVLDAIQRYVAAGGIWWETGGFSFFYPCWPVREQGPT